MTASQGLLPGASSPARSPAKRPKPTRARQLQSPSKRRQLDAGAHNTRSRSAQQGAACQVPGNAARDIVSDSEEDDIVVHLSDDNSSSSEEEPVSDAQPGPSYRADSAAGMHLHVPGSLYLWCAKQGSHDPTKWNSITAYGAPPPADRSIALPSSLLRKGAWTC